MIEFNRVNIEAVTGLDRITSTMFACVLGVPTFRFSFIKDPQHR